MGNCCDYNQETKKLVYIQTVTWKRDTQQLFDYENDFSVVQRFKVTQPGYLIRLDEDIEYIYIDTLRDPIKKLKYEQMEKNNELTHLISLKEDYQISHSNIEIQQIQNDQSHNNYHISNDDQYHQKINDQSPWIIIKDYQQNQGYQLKKGDYLKFGRIILKVNVINLGNEKQKQQIMVNYSDQQNKIQEDDKLTSLLEKQCRICFCDQNDEENPLICPCACAGSMKYVHLNCLRQWIENKIGVNCSYCCTTYFWKNFDCEICQQALPSTFHIKNKKFQLIQINTPTQDYIIMEIIQGPFNSLKGFLVVNMHGFNSMILGRGIDSQIKIEDISVSRVHSKFEIINQNIYIKDLNSKFGTLVLMQQPIQFDDNIYKIGIQVNRSIIKLEIQNSYVNQIKLCYKSNLNQVHLPHQNQSENDISSDHEIIISN